MFWCYHAEQEKVLVCLSEKRVGKNIRISDIAEKKGKKRLMELASGTFPGNKMLYKEVNTADTAYKCTFHESEKEQQKEDL